MPSRAFNLEFIPKTQTLVGPEALPVLGVDELADLHGLDDQALARLGIDRLARTFREYFRDAGHFLTIRPLTTGIV